MALTLLLVVWLASTRGMFRCADDYLVDLSGARQSAAFAPENVLLVYADAALFKEPDGRLVDLIRQVQKYQPSQIGIAAAVSNQQQQRLSGANLSSNVVIGRSAPETGQNFLKLWIDGQAVYRWHRARIVAENTVVESLEARLARGQQGAGARIPRGVFGIRFQGGSSSIPHLDQQAFAGQSVIAEMVADRIVLIGQYEEAGLGFVTPTTVGSDRMSRLEVHGNILQTILRRDGIFHANSLLALMSMLVVSITSSFLFRQVGASRVIQSGIAVLVTITAATWAMMILFSVQLPITALWSLGLLNFVGVMTSRFQVLTNFFHQWKLLRRINLKTTRRHSYDEIWPSVATSTLQIFHPQKIALFEIELGTRKLVLRETVGCDKSDIIERRRDINRAPYRSAFEQRGLVELVGRPVLKPADSETGCDETVELLIPLIHGADPIGALVLEIDKAAMQEWRDFGERLTEFADEMADFLAGIRERELEKLMAHQSLYRHRHLPERIVARSLYQDEVDHRAYEDVLARELDCSETAVAIYDVFGNLLTSNQRMIDQLQRRDVVIDSANCSEVLAALTGREVDSCRQWVRRCLVDCCSEEIMIGAQEAGQAPSMLFIKPLRPNEAGHQSGIEDRYLSIQMIDGTVFHDMYKWREKISETQTAILHEQLSRFQQFATEINEDTESVAELSIATEILDALDQCQSAIESGLSERPQDWIVVEINPILQAAIRSCRDAMQTGGIRVRTEIEIENGEAISNPVLLRRDFASILDCLIQDASRQSEIVIRAAKAENRLRYTFDVETKSAESHNEFADMRGKAASILIEQKNDRFADAVTRLRHWDANLRMTCGSSYQLSIELDLACSIKDLLPASHNMAHV